MTETQAQAEGVAAATARRPLWTRGFALLGVVTILCYCSHMLVAVVLPLFVGELGGSPVIAGLVFTSFSVTSFVLRPLIGHLTDAWSVRGTLLGGAGLLGSLGLSLVVPSLWLAFISNAVRGIGWGAFSTASSTAVALFAPQARRGEASGFYSLFTIMASAIAPALGLWLLGVTGQFEPVFVLAGLAGALAMLAIWQMPGVGDGASTLREALSMPRQGVNLESFFERRVLLVSLLLICVTMMSPVTFAFVPLHARAVGVDNIGLYFVVSALASGLSRLVLGPLLDRGSRGLWIALGYGVLIPSFGIYAVATTIEVFLVAGTLNAIGHSLAQPALMAFAMDRAEPGRMGKAMATFSMFYRVGEGVGAPIAGALIVAFGYPSMYLGAMGYAVVGLVLTALNWGTAGRPTGRAGA